MVTLYTVIDDAISEIDGDRLPNKLGRPSILSNSEMITILVYTTVFLRQKNLKDILKFMGWYHIDDFPQLPSYQAFVAHAHRTLPLMFHVLSLTLVRSKVNFADSTMLEVCKLFRSDSHKVAKNIAQYGKNHQGWHYGFKLHAAIGNQGLFSSFCFSSAEMYDAQMLPQLVKDYMKILIGDSHYGASVMRRRMWKDHQLIIITPPHWKQKSKIATKWQNALLSMRSKIESVFDILKEHLHLVTSFPRSVKGYFVHYLRILLAYQFSILLKCLKLKEN